MEKNYDKNKQGQHISTKKWSQCILQGSIPNQVQQCGAYTQSVRCNGSMEDL